MVETAAELLIDALHDDADLDRAAALLNDGRRVAILAGRGSLGASAELEAVAEILGAPIVKALLGKAAVPDDSPYTTGQTGLLGSRPSQEAVAAGEYGYDSTYFRRMLAARAVDRARHMASSSRRIRRRPCTAIHAARFRACGTSSTSTITHVSNTCSSTARCRRSAANCSRICRGPAWDSNCAAGMPTASSCGDRRCASCVY